MSKLIPTDKSIQVLSRNALQYFSIQGALSSLFTFLVFTYPSLAEFLSNQFWIFYLAVTLYVLLALIRLLYMHSSQLLNKVVLYLLIASSVTFDGAWGSITPSSTFQIIVFLFSGVFGLFLYFSIADKLKSPYWLILFMFLAVDCPLVGFIIAGFDTLLTLIFAAIGFGYGGFLFWSLSDICERYHLEKDDEISAAIFAYVDILCLPFIYTKIQRCYLNR